MIAGPRRPTRVLLPLGLAICLSLFGDLTLYAVLASERHTVGLSIGAIGVMLSINRLIRIPGNPLIGTLYDRVGRRRLFLLGMGLGALSTFGYSVATGFWPFLLTRLTWGTAWTLLNVGGMAIIHDIGTSTNRGRLSGAYNAWILVGFAVGPLFGGVLVDLVGFQATMRLYAITTALGLLVAAVFLPETQPQALRSRNSAEAVLPLRQAVARLAQRARGALHASPRLLSVLLLVLLFQFAGEGVALSTFNLLLAQRLGDRVQIGALTLGVASATGIVSALRSLVAATSGPIAGRISDTHGDRGATMTAALLLGMVSFAGLAFAQSLPLIVLAIVVGAISAGAGAATLSAAIGRLAPAARRGAVMGAFATAGDIGATLGPLLAYAVVVVAPVSCVYVVCAAAFAFGLLLTRRAF